MKKKSKRAKQPKVLHLMSYEKGYAEGLDDGYLIAKENQDIRWLFIGAGAAIFGMLISNFF